MSRFASFFAVIALAFGFQVTPASAAPFTVDVTTFPYTDSFLRTGGLFNDFFDFSLSGLSDASGAVAAVPPFSLGAKSYSVVDLSIGLYHAADTTFSSPIALDSSSVSHLLSAGDYVVKVTGTTTGSAGGFYAIALDAVSAVPEPGSWMMIGAGLLAIGTIARRRMNG